ncbi:hypothetical protein QBC39DRAFT_404626 [Podospora conica]|nr:hypothetical protein QBC39DRAFT_404626 [Schizothecium conicum]
MPEEVKVRKIQEWETCRNVKDVRSFLGLTGFYRIWVEGYSILVFPLNDLLKKDRKWEWTVNEQTVMEILKYRLTTKPCLATVIYDDPRYGAIFLMVDASLEGWGAVLEQIGPDKKRHPCRFESGVWKGAEKTYDATKRELRGMLCALRANRRYLYGIHFTIETDALVLVHQLNGAVSEVPGALLMRWIAWIRNFDFTVKHIPGTKNAAADALSRKPPGPSDLEDKDKMQDVDDFVDAQIYTLKTDLPLSDEDRTYVDIFSQHLLVHDLSPTDAKTYSQELFERGLILRGHWSERSHDIAEFLTTLTIPPHVKTARGRKALETEALTFFVKDFTLWKRAKLPKDKAKREELQKKGLEEKAKAHAKLIELRVKTILEAESRHEEAAEKVEAARKKWAAQRNNALRHKMRPDDAKVEVGDKVLVYEETRRVNKSANTKLQWRWKGPFVITGKSEKKAYSLAELDGTPVKGTFHPRRLKRFFELDGVQIFEDDDVPMQSDLQKYWEAACEDAELTQEHEDLAEEVDIDEAYREIVVGGAIIDAEEENARLKENTRVTRAMARKKAEKVLKEQGVLELEKALSKQKETAKEDEPRFEVAIPQKTLDGYQRYTNRGRLVKTIFQETVEDEPSDDQTDPWHYEPTEAEEIFADNLFQILWDPALVSHAWW